jgi:hypothetical protein
MSSCLFWPIKRVYRNITVEKVNDKVYNGIGRTGLKFVIIAKEFGSLIGPRGYIFVNNEYIESHKSEHESAKAIEDIVSSESGDSGDSGDSGEIVPSTDRNHVSIFQYYVNDCDFRGSITNGDYNEDDVPHREYMRCGVVGGITYFRDNFLGSKIPNGNVVLGFDTTHDECPKDPSIEYMIDNIIELENWIYYIASGKKMEEPNYFVGDTPKQESESQLDYCLRILKEAEKKVTLPDETLDPKEYILELLENIEKQGDGPDETVEDPDANKRLGDLFMSMMRYV